MKKTALEELVKGKQGVSTNKEMMDLVGKTDQSSGVWVAIKKPEAAGTPAEMDFKSLYASIDVASGLKLDAGMRQNSAEQAKKTVDDGTKALEQFKAMIPALGKVELSANDSDVLIKVALSAEELQELMQSAMPMMGGMMGGGF